ncbi:hypothetical protein, partial [Longicatena caecimuris]|uniref:hypothetical protein n=1 Tax=Longicatena caecimuris TaxID=1796635 RepID=UPI0018AC7BA5
IYEKGDLQGEPPVDNNIYGYAPGQKNYLTVPDQGALHLDNIRFMGWESYDGIVFFANDEITYKTLESKSSNSDVLYLTPVIDHSPEIKLDLTSLPEDIKTERLKVLHGKYSMIALPDLSDLLKDTNYIHVGWINPKEPDYIIPSLSYIDTFIEEEIITFKPIIITKSEAHFKIVYDCPNEVNCPIDNTDYMIGDMIRIKNMPSQGIVKDGKKFFSWTTKDESYFFKTLYGITAENYYQYISKGELRLFPFYNEIDLDFYCDPNGEDNFSFMEYESNYRLQLYDNGSSNCYLGASDNKYFMGWSLTPDNKNPDEFLSYWTATMNDVKELIKEKEKPVRLYAQWMSEEELKNRNDFIKVTFELDQGNGNKLALTTYAPKGFKLDVDFLIWFNRSELNQILTYDHSYLDYEYIRNKLYVEDLDGEYKKDILLPMDVSEVIYEIKMINREIPTSYIVSNHGVLKDKTGEVTKYIRDKGEDVYFHTLDLPAPVAENGYQFIGWKVVPGFSEFYPISPSSINDEFEDIYKEWYTLKKEIWSTEELSKTPIHEGNLVDSLLQPYKRSYLLTDLSLMAIFEPTGKVEYYYDGVKDDEATETLTD